MAVPPDKISNDAFAYLLDNQDLSKPKLMRIATLSDLQIGLPEFPAELQITGKFSLSSTRISLLSFQTIYYPANTTVLFVVIDNPLNDSQSTIVLPDNPRQGQTCYIKDESGTSDVCRLQIIGANSASIDGRLEKILNYKHGAFGFIWSGYAWTTITASGIENVLDQASVLQQNIAIHAQAIDEVTRLVSQIKDDVSNITVVAPGGGTGDVVGPASATDNAIARFDLTTGKLIQNSGVTINDSNNMTVSGRIIVTGGTTSVTDATLGNAAVGSFPYYDGGGNSAVYAMFGHKDLDHSSVTTNYALYQDNTGNTSINASTGKNLYFAINNVAMGAITNDIGSGVDAILFTGDLATRTDVLFGNYTGASATTVYAGTGDLNIGHNAADRTVNLGTGNNTTEQDVTVGSTSGRSLLVLRAGTGDMYLTGAVATDFIIGHTAGTGDITVGRSTASNTINIGNANTATTKTQTINIGAGTPAGTGKATVAVGNAGGASSLTLTAGTGNITLSGSGGQTVITGSSTTYTDAMIGAWEIGSLPATQAAFPNDYAFVGHKALDHSADGNYALVQSNVGDTYLGAALAKAVVFKNGTSIIGYLDDNEISLTGKPSTAQTVTLGSTYTTSATTINAGSGSIDIGTTPQSRTTNIATGVANQAVSLGSTHGGSSLTLSAGSGSLNLGTSNAVRSINIGTGTSVQTIGIGTGAAANAISIGSNAASIVTINGGDTLNLYTDNGSLTIDSGTGNTSIGTFGYARTTNIATGVANQAVSLGSTHGGSSLTLSAGSGSLNLGTSNSARTINIGADPTGTATTMQTINIGAKNTSGYNMLHLIDGNSLNGHEIYILSDNGTQTTGTSVVEIGTVAAATTIDIGKSTVGAKAVTIGGTGGASATNIYAGTGGITLSGSATTIITGSSTTDAEAYIGLAEIGELPWSKSIFPGVFAMFGHKTLAHTDLNYGLVQSNVGDTYLNAASGKSVFIANNGSAIAQINTSVTSFTGSLTTTITGNSTTVSGSNSLTLMSRVNGGRLLLSGSSILMTGSIGINLPGRTPVVGSGIHIKQQKDPTASGTTVTDNSAALRIEDDDGDGWIIGAGGTGQDNYLTFSWDLSSVGGDGTSTAQGYIRNNANAFTLMNFTGQHRCAPHAGVVENFSEKIGLIVITSGDYLNPISGSTTGSYNRNIGINDATPTVLLASSRNDKRAFGIVSEIEDVSDGAREFAVGKFVSVTESGGAEDNRLFINAIGEGAIWVCNINGSLENGDYITTCEIPGYGMKQDDDLLHNYTVAKITCNCDFSLNNDVYQCEEFIHEGVTYRRAFVGCTYHCG